MDFESFPFSIGWELTLACNLRCHHCASAAGQKNVNELTLEESLRICDQFPDLLVQEVNFTGGEPFLRKDWPAIASYLKELGIRTKIITNGLELNLDTVFQIRKSGISSVGISLDGLEGTHDYIRDSKNLFNNILKGLATLIKFDVPVTVITVVNMLNVKELDSIFELLKSIGVNSWQIQPVFPLGRVSELPQLKLTETGYTDMDEFIKEKLSVSAKDNPKIILADSYGYFTEFHNTELTWQGCNAGIVGCGITSDGKIKGCLSLPDEFVEGDLRKNDLWDIWFHPDSFSYTRQFSREDLGNYCQNCDKSEQCMGGCSAMSYGATKSFHNDPYCFYRIQKEKLNGNYFI